MTASDNEANDVLKSTKKLASYNMILQLAFRVLTFITNAIILRFITRDILGVVNVRLTLLYNTILFMSREAFRRACLSGNEVTKGKWRLTINLLWCVIPVGLACSLLLSYAWIHLLEAPDEDLMSHYPTSVIVFAFCAWAELLIEPLWVVSQAFQFVRLKVFVEGIAIMAKYFLAITLILIKPQWGLICFCLSQIAHSVVSIILYYGYYIWFVQSGQAKKMEDFPFRKLSDFFPQFTANDGRLINENAKNLTLSFFRQGILKQLLTEGERYVMTILNVLSFADQGVYDVINNLGSLAARFIFLPIEESFYVFFAKMLTRGKSASSHDKNRINIISSVLSNLLRFVVLIGSIILAFGLPYSTLLLDLYGGSILTSGTGPMLLRAYCLYVLLLAINGTTECFVFASMDQSQIDGYNRKMFAFSFIFLASSYYLTNWIGSVGFIIANCFNMTARISHSLLYIHRFYEGSDLNPLNGIIPNKFVGLNLILCSIICLISECHLSSLLLVFKLPLIHVCVGAISLLSVAVAIFFKEAEVVSFIRSQYRTPSSKHD